MQNFISTIPHALVNGLKKSPIRSVVTVVMLISILAGLFTMVPQHMVGARAAAASPSLPEQTRVGIHNTYEKATLPYLVDALDSGAGMIELDVWQNFLWSGKYEVSHDPFGNDNNCETASNYNDLRHQPRDQGFASCLNDIRLWHKHNPRHQPLLLKLELKNGFNTDDGFGPTQLDTFLAKHLGSDIIYRPADMTGKYPNLDSASRAGAWPSADQLTGKVLVFLEAGTFEKKVKSYFSDQEYADHLTSLQSKHQFGQAMAFPAWNGVSTNDPRSGNRKLWEVIFDGDASGYMRTNTNFYRTNHYLLIMDDAQRVSPAIDDHHPSVSDATKRVNLLAAHGASIASSDWTNPKIIGYVTNRS